MSDLPTTLKSLDDVEAPDLWPGVQQRSNAPVKPWPRRTPIVLRVGSVAAIVLVITVLVSVGSERQISRSRAHPLAIAAADEMEQPDARYRFRGEGEHKSER